MGQHRRQPPGRPGRRAALLLLVSAALAVPPGAYALAGRGGLDSLVVAEQGAPAAPAAPDGDAREGAADGPAPGTPASVPTSGSAGRTAAAPARTPAPSVRASSARPRAVPPRPRRASSAPASRTSTRPSRSSPRAVAPSRPPHAPGEAARVLELVNVERARAGCGPVRLDDRLTAASLDHSQDMAARGYLSHTTPEGRTPWDRARAAGYDSATGENIAQGQRTADDVVRAWMGSEGHRRNILACGSVAMGLGLARDGSGVPYWTQMFGSV